MNGVNAVTSKWITIDGRVFLLNFETGRYAALLNQDAINWIAKFGDENICNSSVIAKNVSRLEISTPTVIDCYLVRRKSAKLIKSVTFGEAYTRLTAMYPDATATAPVNTVLEAFAKIDGLFFGTNVESDCLIRSLSLYHILAKRNIKAAHFIGVNPYPFQAHAWVTINNVPVLDARERTSKFRPICISTNDIP